jgi:HJR/Mrr/RecB family endonuclease
MQNAKFNGLIAEVLEQYPNVDVDAFVEEKLHIPKFAAKELAERIERQYCTQFVPIQKISSADKPAQPEQSHDVYAVEVLSAKEFERFLKWLLGELGFEVHPAKYDVNSGFDLVVSKNGEKMVIQAKHYPKGTKLSNAVILKAKTAMAVYGCKRSIIVTTSDFSQQALETAKKLNIDLWNKSTLGAKIEEAKTAANDDLMSCFPKYKGSLLKSLISLEDTKDFILERKANGKYDVHLPGIKFPVLSFQARYEDVIRCVFRIKNNEPIDENDGSALIRSDRNERYGPDGERAYALILKYLEQFIE